MGKRLMSMLTAIAFNMLAGTVMAFALDVPAIAGAAGMTAVGMVMGMVPQTAGTLREGVYTEVWLGEIVRKLREGLSGSWLDGIPDASTVVENDVIHLVDVGIDPDVLVNNTTYPIPLQELKDGDISISLDKFTTKVTPVTDDELYAISYDKMARVKESHGAAISEAKFRRAAHSLCAGEHTAKTPVLKSSGARVASTGRLRLTVDDLVAMKEAMDSLKAPATGRRLVLCMDHVNDLLRADQAFREQYNIDRNTGKVGMLYGFEVYCYADCPVYTTAGKKKAVGATADAGEFQASFAFYDKRVFKATGSTKMYYSAASTDPEYQRNKINFTHRFIAMPKKADAGVVMTSGYEAAKA